MSKVAFITGRRGDRVCVRGAAGAGGWSVVVAAKTASRTKLPGTIYTAAEELRALGGEVLPVMQRARGGFRGAGGGDAGSLWTGGRGDQ